MQVRILLAEQKEAEVLTSASAFFIYPPFRIGSKPCFAMKSENDGCCSVSYSD
jgi:hypothetical protein